MSPHLQEGETRGRPENGRQPSGGPDQANARTLITVGLTAALALAFASAYPPALVPLVLKALLFWASIGGVVLALWRGDAIQAEHLTAWDQTAILLALSLFAGFFVDPAAVEALMQQQGLAG